jgi:hypothetical protein
MRQSDGALLNLGNRVETQNNKNAANGYAGLNGSSKLTLSQMQEVMALADLSDVSAKTGSGSTVVMDDAPTFANNSLVFTIYDKANSGATNLKFYYQTDVNPDLELLTSAGADAALYTATHRGKTFSPPIDTAVVFRGSDGTDQGGAGSGNGSNATLRGGDGTSGGNCTIRAGLKSSGTSGDLDIQDASGASAIKVNGSDGSLNANKSIAMADAKNISVGTTTGTQIATGSTQKLGFWGATPAAQQTVTGSRAGNAALASLLTKLATLGIIVDGSSA